MVRERGERGASDESPVTVVVADDHPYVDAHRQPPNRPRRSRRYRRFHLEPLRGGEPGPRLILLRGK